MTDANEKRRVLAEMLETATALSKHGLLGKSELRAMRVLCAAPPEYSATRVQAIRKTKARMSQAVFATFLNVSVSSVQKWESAESGKHPGGAAAKLIQLIDEKGIDAVFV